MRLCVLLLVASCGPASSVHETKSAPPAVRETKPAPPVVHEPHVQSVQAPLGPQLVFEDPAPAPAPLAPKPRVPGRRAPCFADRDVLVGSQIYNDLWKHAPGMSSDQPPSGTYGTCTIKDGQLRDASGTLVAELHCGITVYAPGIIDPFGFEIGAHGKQVAVEQRPGDVLCWQDDDKHARCWMSSDEGALAHYMFAAKLPSAADSRGFLRGKLARKFFESHVVSHFTVRMTCH